MKGQILFAMFILFIFSCTNPKKQITREVKKLEMEIDKKFSKEKADILLVAYDSYIEKFPKDTTSRLYMAKGVELSIMNNDPHNALRLIDLFLANFPDDPKAGLMQFKKGMIYDLLLQDGLRALAEYDIFLKNYPEDPLKQDAINAILLIKNPETFMANMKKGQDSLANSNKNKELSGK